MSEAICWSIQTVNAFISALEHFESQQQFKSQRSTVKSQIQSPKPFNIKLIKVKLSRFE
jgi:hypothetical protein